MPASRPPIGELPEDLAVQILRTYGDDELTDLGALMRDTEASMQQIAAVIARDCFEGRWRGRMGFDTRNRIVGMIENHFTPAEGEPVDPLALNANAVTDLANANRPPDTLLDRPSDAVAELASPIKLHERDGDGNTTRIQLGR